MISKERLRAYCEYLQVSPDLVKQDGTELYTLCVSANTGKPCVNFYHNGYYVLTHEELRDILAPGFPIEKLPGDNFTCSKGIKWHFQLT